MKNGDKITNDHQNVIKDIRDALIQIQQFLLNKNNASLGVIAALANKRRSEILGEILQHSRQKKLDKITAPILGEIFKSHEALIKVYSALLIALFKKEKELVIATIKMKQIESVQYLKGVANNAIDEICVVLENCREEHVENRIKLWELAKKFEHTSIYNGINKQINNESILFFEMIENLLSDFISELIKRLNVND